MGWWVGGSIDIESFLYPPTHLPTPPGIFYLAIPLGAATGYALGGILGQAFGWRAAFLFCGVPGLVVAFLVMLINDPPHGVNDEPHTGTHHPPTHPPTHPLLCLAVLVMLINDPPHGVNDEPYTGTYPPTHPPTLSYVWLSSSC